MKKLGEQREWWQETRTHIICDFLSEVGLCDEDLGDFLTGSVKHTGHQRVFVIPQSGSLLKVIDKKKKTPQTFTKQSQIKTTAFFTTAATKVTTHRRTRAPYKGQTHPIYFPPSETQKQIISRLRVY